MREQHALGETPRTEESSLAVRGGGSSRVLLEPFPTRRLLPLLLLSRVLDARTPRDAVPRSCGVVPLLREGVAAAGGEADTLPSGEGEDLHD